MHVADLSPERRHIHNQVLDHRQVAERCNRDVPMPFKFLTEGGAAGQLLTAVDRHRTRAANSRATGIAERDTPVALVLDANQRVKHRHPAPDIEPDLLRMRGGIDFGIKSLNREGQAHRRYRRITIILSHPRRNFARGLKTSHRRQPCASPVDAQLQLRAEANKLDLPSPRKKDRKPPAERAYHRTSMFGEEANETVVEVSRVRRSSESSSDCGTRLS